MKPWDYLCIGHITRDVTPDGDRVGGTVAYSGHVAQTLGCHTAVLTSCAADYPGLLAMKGIAVQNVATPVTSTFENIYRQNGREQTLHARAATITSADLPPGWESSKIVHFGPLTNEIDESLVQQFPHSMIGLTPQGWMRRWDATGRVSAGRWPQAETILPLADVVVLSEEDFPDQDMLTQFAALSKLLILTENVAGCKLFQQGTITQVPAPAVSLVEPTGAGDIFAAAFFVDFARNGRDPFRAAEFANFIAAHSITCAGLPEKMQLLANLLQETDELNETL
jgi:sugar/nucleoside kinase (ribokinase family)